MSERFITTKGVSTLSLIVLLLVSGVIGAILSYLWTVGYYVDLGLNVPEDISVAITNVSFPLLNSTYFEVTVLNPTYSKEDANITSVVLIVANTVELNVNTTPATPYPLRKGEAVTFRCNERWGEHTGGVLIVGIFVEDGSGAARSYITEYIDLDITEISLDTEKSINEFNVTVHNRSKHPLDVSKLLLGLEEIPEAAIFVDTENVTLPYTILENETIVLTCFFPLWDSKTNVGVLGKTTAITLDTLQGYQASSYRAFPKPVSLAISNVTFPLLNTTQFVLTNELQSPHYVNLTDVIVNVEEEYFTIANTNATDHVLQPGESTTIVCEDARLNWETWKGKEVTISVYTTQGFVADKEEAIPDG
ncbi:MAG: hypothetical protein JSV64_07555 [Candidatus Bathyarchaeota archaeon]|jgi:hypothetical protein|nr:MAG: hypothetical protein JSV64_07555 [Candidatus Bathyarchaeota archaeon]